MLRTVLKSKIHGGRVTACHLHYEGSITLAADVLEAAGLLPFEQVHVLNLNNGERFLTYTIKGPRGSRTIQLNGPAARLGLPGDPLTILGYGLAAEGEAVTPRIVQLNAANKLNAPHRAPRSGTGPTRRGGRR